MRYHTYEDKGYVNLKVNRADPVRHIRTKFGKLPELYAPPELFKEKTDWETDDIIGLPRSGGNITFFVSRKGEVILTPYLVLYDPKINNSIYYGAAFVERPPLFSYHGDDLVHSHQRAFMILDALGEF
jgi:hypothetical protein